MGDGEAQGCLFVVTISVSIAIGCLWTPAVGWLVFGCICLLAVVLNAIVAIATFFSKETDG